ncbi:MAG: hypothetical protein HXY34_06955 [Candidatus Thorarchaeota archaeon]|nr:hypothetical protein [Candidatus Thorarchaeota archaeon]
MMMHTTHPRMQAYPYSNTIDCLFGGRHVAETDPISRGVKHGNRNAPCQEILGRRNRSHIAGIETVLLSGMAFVGSYFWYALASTVELTFFHMVFFGTGGILFLSTFLLAHLKTRSSRTLMTMFSGTVTGVHGYLDLTLFDWGPGIVLFAWIAFGLLLSFSAYAWLKEL